MPGWRPGLTSETSSLVLSSAGILDRLVALMTGLEVRERGRGRLVAMMREKHLRDGPLHLLPGHGRDGIIHH